MNAEQVNIVVSEIVFKKLAGYNLNDHPRILEIADAFEGELLDGGPTVVQPETEEELVQQFEDWFNDKITNPAYAAPWAEDNYYDSKRAGLDPETGEEVEE
jgi:hypothetical protein